MKIVATILVIESLRQKKELIHYVYFLLSHLVYDDVNLIYWGVMLGLALYRSHY